MDATLDATERDPSGGKSGARKVRQAGKLPAVIYGRDATATPVAIDPNALTTLFRRTRDRNTVVSLQLPDRTIPCLVRDVQRHPLSRQILHVDFYKLDPGQEVVVNVPLEPQGKPAGAVLGGRLRLLAREVPVRCAWDKIPSLLTYDVSDMEINDFVRCSELATPEGVELAYETDFNVLTVYGKRSLASLDLPEFAEEGEGAEGEGEEGEEGEESEESETESE